MAAIEFSGVTKRFRDGTEYVRAVDDVDLHVTDGEFLVLVGPSGCGKSTTLRLIAGLETPTDGDISIGNEQVTDREPKDRNVSMVFQDYALYPHMTARENMAFGMKSVGSYTDEEIDTRIEETAEMLGISTLLDRKPGSCSGGEQQRIAIGRSLIRDPDVFLMDEPLSNLDAKLRVEMRAELQKLHEEIQTTTVYVTHDQTEAMTLGDRVAVMDDGSIQQVDPPQRLYDYPETRFVAEFIGSPSMNVFEVTLTDTRTGWRADRDNVSLPLEGANIDDDRAGTRVDLGLRPDDLRLVTDSESTVAHRIHGEVTLLESLGDNMLVHFRVGDLELQVLSEDPRLPVSEGDSIAVTHDEDRLHLFDRETGRLVYHSDPAWQSQRPVDDGQEQHPSVRAS